MKKILIIVAIVLVVLFLSKDLIVSTILTFGVTSFTDLPVDVKSVKVGIFKSTVEIRGFKLYNPKKIFKDRVMADIPELYIDYDIGSFLTGTKHLRMVRLNLKEFDVIKNENGELNLDSLKAIQLKKGGPSGAKKNSKFKIDVLDLKIGKVVYKDYSKGLSPVVKEFEIGLNERYENITDPYAFASLVVFKAVANTSISHLANFDLRPLKDASYDAIISATKVVSDAAGEAVKKAAESIKDLF